MSTIPQPRKEVPPGDELARSFATEAPIHDRHVSPLLALSRRLMENALPDVRDKVAIGVGYALENELFRLHARGARPVQARFRPDPAGTGSEPEQCIDIVEPDVGLADLIICSFALSYVADLAAFAERVAELAIPGADLYLVDVHPETDRLGWRKPLAPDALPSGLAVHVRELPLLRQAFDAAGFELDSLLEPHLGHPEKRLFENIVRPDLFDQVRHMPAIYVFHFRRRLLSRDRLKRITYRRRRPLACHLTGARVALGPYTSVQADIVLDPDRIRGIYDKPSQARAQRAEDDMVIDVSGHVLLPGLINAYDHLASAIDSRYDMPREAALWMGALRNLLNGVTTVVHREAELASTFTEAFPVRVVRNYGWADSVAPSEIVPRFAATPPDAPFLIHLDASNASETRRVIASLQALGVINDRTVIVHDGGLDCEALDALHRAGASQIWCPSAAMYSGAAVDSAFVISNHRVALGTGSSPETSQDIFAEVRDALALGVPPEAVYSMLTSRACSILRLRNGEGRIVAGTPGDLIVIADRGGTPAETLCAANVDELEAVFVGGRPAVASREMTARWPERWRHGMEPILFNGKQRWVRWQLQRLVRNLVDRAGSPQLAGKVLTV